MSLSTLIADPASLIGHYLWQRFHQTMPLARRANLMLSATETTRPAAGGYPWATVARAVDFRVRWHFAMSFPRQVVALRGARHLLAEHPDRLSDTLIETFFVDLSQTLSSIGTTTTTPDLAQERLLARYAYVMGLFEEVARNPFYEQGPLVAGKPLAEVSDLLMLADEPVLDDIAALAERFTGRYGALRERPFTVDPLLTGSRQVGRTGADLVLDGTLVLVKTTAQPHIEARWLRHLMGCALLDFADDYRLHSVGLYMARQGMLIIWPLAAFAATLMGTTRADIGRLRRECQQVCRSARGEPIARSLASASAIAG